MLDDKKKPSQMQRLFDFKVWGIQTKEMALVTCRRVVCWKEMDFVTCLSINRKCALPFDTCLSTSRKCAMVFNTHK